MVTNNLPEKFLEKISKLFPEDKLDEILSSFNTSALPSFRVNSIKTNREEVYKKLTGAGFCLEQINYYEDAYLLNNRSVSELTETDVYKNGEIYIQSLSSMIPVLLLDPKPDELVLDIAAAPGSKTTQIACFMKNKGEIVANDISKSRIFKLLNILKEQSVTNTKITNFPGQLIWKKYPEYFDKVLVDVPCSMEGRFKTFDEKSYKDWSQKKVKVLSVKQQYLLRSAISATKVGGVIVYSTCTISPEENEAVLDWVLKKEGNNIEVEEIKINGLKTNPGLTFWNKNLNKKIKNTLRILPSKEMEGFFVAKIRKLKPNL